MRTYGKITNKDGSRSWIEVTTDANGFNDAVYLTTLAQVLRLNLNEDPFFADWGIPQFQTIITQVFPDFYVNFIQTKMMQYFASLSITRVQNSNPPTYNVTVVTHLGSILNTEIAT